MFGLVGRSISAITQVIRGLGTVFKHTFREPITLSFPDDMPELPATFRGRLALAVNPGTGEHLCISCLQCERVCPDKCIQITSHKSPETNKPELINFKIDHGLCMFCGLCTEVCPTNCIINTNDFEMSDYTRESLVYDIRKLTLTQDESAHYYSKKELPPPKPKPPKPAAKPAAAAAKPGEEKPAVKPAVKPAAKAEGAEAKPADQPQAKPDAPEKKPEAADAKPADTKPAEAKTEEVKTEAAPAVSVNEAPQTPPPAEKPNAAVDAPEKVAEANSVGENQPETGGAKAETGAIPDSQGAPQGASPVVHVEGLPDEKPSSESAAADTKDATQAKTLIDVPKPAASEGEAPRGEGAAPSSDSEKLSEGLSHLMSFSGSGEKSEAAESTSKTSESAEEKSEPAPESPKPAEGDSANDAPQSTKKEEGEQ